MDTIKHIIPSVIGDLVQKSPPQMDVAQIWQRVCGCAHGSHVAGVKQGVLTVVVDSSARKMQLFRKRQELLEEMKNKIPTIKTIYFKVGSV